MARMMSGLEITPQKEFVAQNANTQVISELGV